MQYINRKIRQFEYNFFVANFNLLFAPASKFCNSCGNLK